MAQANRVRTSLSALDAADALASAGQITFDAALDAYRNGVGSITDATLLSVIASKGSSLAKAS